MYDLGIMTSIFLLLTLYMIVLSVVGYTTLTNALFKCTNWILIPTKITNYFECIWHTSLDRKKSDVFLSIIILALSIIPISLIWPISYPIMGYLLIRYKCQCQSDNISSSV